MHSYVYFCVTPSLRLFQKLAAAFDVLYPFLCVCCSAFPSLRRFQTLAALFHACHVRCDSRSVIGERGRSSFSMVVNDSGAILTMKKKLQVLP